jgi:hypothetical protein
VAVPHYIPRRMEFDEGNWPRIRASPSPRASVSVSVIREVPGRVARAKTRTAYFVSTSRRARTSRPIRRRSSMSSPSDSIRVHARHWAMSRPLMDWQSALHRPPELTASVARILTRRITHVLLRRGHRGHGGSLDTSTKPDLGPGFRRCLTLERSHALACPAEALDVIVDPRPRSPRAHLCEHAHHEGICSRRPWMPIDVRVCMPLTAEPRHA